MKKLGCIIIIAMVILMMALGVGLRRRIRTKMAVEGCVHNFSRIALAVKMYADENGDVYPPDLSLLYPEFVDDLNGFVCPLSGDHVGEPADIDSWSSYEYFPENTVGPFSGYSEDPAEIARQREEYMARASDLVVCREKQFNHNWRWELYADGQRKALEREP